MKAVRCHEYGPPELLRMEEVDAPEPGLGEVLVDVHAAGLNFPETLQLMGTRR